MKISEMSRGDKLWYKVVWYNLSFVFNYFIKCVEMYI